MKKREIVIFAGLFAIALAIILIMQFAPGGDNLTVLVTVDSEEYKRIDIDSETKATFTIKTEHGENHVVIENGTVNVIAADCLNQICVDTKKATVIGDIIVCLPHKVVIEIIESDYID